MIVADIRDVITSTVKKMFEAELFPAEILNNFPEFAVEFARNPEHGDYATNVALILAKQVKKPPREVADLILKNLQDAGKIIKHAEVAGPGFINLVVTDKALQNVALRVLQSGEKFGNHPNNQQKVLVEFVSANPTGPLHLGHARGAFMGDAVARLLTAAGYDVTREFYVNDVGNQVKILAGSIYSRYLELFGEKIALAKDAYPGEYIIEIAQIIKDRDGDKWLNADLDEAVAHCAKVGIEENLNSIKATLKQAGIDVDNWYFEHTLHDQKKVDKIIGDYRKLNMVYEAEAAENTDDKVRREESNSAKYVERQLGGTFLKTSQFGDDEDRILLKKNGDKVYLVADLAYHQDKFARGFAKIINVFGADHAGHVPRIRAGMRALGIDDANLFFILVQMVRLLRDGKEVRFSKRAGQIYLLEDLLTEIGVDGTRFNFLMRGAHTQFDFDLNLALEMSNSNPVFYVQYGYARMATLLKRAEQENQAFVGVKKLSNEDLSKIVLPEERLMLKKMDYYPDLVLQAAANLEPHRIINYCQELIAEFHSYFTKYRSTERIISTDKSLTQGRLALVAALKQTLYNALSLLNISAPEYMHATEIDEKN
ncbi:MAG: arginine--tRNA ligase [bacterium]|nr:arginine--tRNA ligase [bacterium]